MSAEARVEPSQVDAELLALIVDQLETGVLVVDRAFTRILFANSAGVAALRVLSAGDGRLPDPLRDALAGGDLALGRFGAANTISSPRGERYVVRAKRLSAYDQRVLVLVTAYVVRDRDLRERLHQRYHLNVRDQEIVLAVRAGLTNAQIAARVGLSEGTVKQYLSRIFSAIGVSNRTELVAALQSLGDPDGTRPR